MQLKTKCLKIKNDCDANDENKLKIQKNLVNEIKKHFEHQIEKSNELLKSEINSSLVKYKKHVELLKIYNTKKLFEKNVYYNQISSTIQIDDIVVSPLCELRDIILSINDFIKRNKYIIKFVDKFCRLKQSNNSDENSYMYYCVSTNLPLLPTYFYTLANIVMNDIHNFKNTYATELDKLVATRGVLSDDGDKFVDKYSGYVIKYIEASNDEGYTEDGYKIVSRDVLLEDEEQQFLNKLNVIDSKFKSPIAKQINNIVSTLNSNIGIKLKQEYVILIIKNVHAQLKLLQKRETYELYVLKLAEKDKKAKPYDTYFDEALIYSILAYYILTIQISIPHIVEGIPFRGCTESFLGYPITSNGDTSLIDYIICVSQKLKSSVRPWKSYSNKQKTRKNGQNEIIY